MRLQSKRIYALDINYKPANYWWEMYRANDQLPWRVSIDKAWADYEKQQASEKQSRTASSTEEA